MPNPLSYMRTRRLKLLSGCQINQSLCRNDKLDKASFMWHKVSMFKRLNNYSLTFAISSLITVVVKTLYSLDLTPFIVTSPLCHVSFSQPYKPIQNHNGIKLIKPSSLGFGTLMRGSLFLHKGKSFQQNLIFLIFFSVSVKYIFTHKVTILSLFIRTFKLKTRLRPKPVQISNRAVQKTWKVKKYSCFVPAKWILFSFYRNNFVRNISVPSTNFVHSMSTISFPKKYSFGERKFEGKILSLEGFIKGGNVKERNIEIFKTFGLN